MGNQHAKKGEKTLFTPEELKILEASYRSITGITEKLTNEKLLKQVRSNLQQAWSSIIDEHLAECTINYLFTGEEHRVTSIHLKRYAEPYYIVERGSIDEQLKFLAGSLDSTDATQFAMKELETYVASVLRSYISIQSHANNQAFDSWKTHGYSAAERTIVPFAKGMIRSLAKETEHRVDIYKLERWIQLNPLFIILWREVFCNLYSRNSGKRLGSAVIDSHIVPALEGLPTGTNYTPILEMPHVIFINNNLPNEMRHKWRFLFSSKIMGESFSTMLGKIINKGPTLLVVEDEDRYIFAGYAPASWALKPQFVGDDTSMLFTLSPAMRCFTATGYNDHYQYLNLNQQTMPNGLGMGGQFNYWGLWIDCEYGLGQSCESCTTYQDYLQLSKRKEFRIRNMEVFAIGDEPKKDEDDEDGQKRSILDKNMEDRVMLELSGKTMHSDGLREPELDL